MSRQEESGRVSGVAIIGLSGRFPGAGSSSEFWANLRAGRESITVLVDGQRLGASESSQRPRCAAGANARGRLDGIDGFDAAFFGMSVPAASLVDPQSRLFLECAWEAFEHAAYVGERVEGPVAVFAAPGPPVYMVAPAANHMGGASGDAAPGPDVLSALVSSHLKLTGPSMDVQTAGGASLAAVHLACQSLLNGECDLALAGGATVYPDQSHGSAYPVENVSPDGGRPVDAGVTGAVLASAVGCVVLQRLEDAVRAGSHILAVIRGSAINHSGGRDAHDAAPGLAAHIRVVGEALAVAGVHPDEVSYIETQGIVAGGDPVEMVALTRAFRASTAQRQFCAVGSVNGNIGHAGDTAGIVGLIKVVLALQHLEIPATLRVAHPNPNVDVEIGPFYVNTTLRDWTVPAGRRRIAGVTARGEGGTNLHLLVEEAPDPPPAAPSRSHQMLVLSAHTPTALDAATERLLADLRAAPATPLADVAYTLLEGRAALAHRRVLVAGDAIQTLSAAEGGQVIEGTTPGRQAPSIAWMFPGGGPYPGVGAGLDSEPPYRQALDEAISSLDPDLEIDVRRLLRQTPAALAASSRPMDGLSRTLPAIVAVQYAVGRLLEEWGITPAGVIGDGPGEYAAACFAGVFDIQQAMALTAFEGRLRESLQPIEDFERFCRTMKFQPPTIPFVSGATGEWMTVGEATDPADWGRLRQRASRVNAGLRTLMALPHGVFIEIGPGRTLTSLLEQLPNAPTVVVPTLRRPEEADSDVAVLLTTLGRLWAAGVPIDAHRIFAGERRRRVALPTYPFERLRCWRDADPEARPRPAAGLAKRPDLADWFAVPAWARSAPPARVSVPSSSWLVLTDDSPLATDLVAELRNSGHHVTAVAPGSGFAHNGPGRYSVHPGNRLDYEALARALRQSGQRPEQVLHLWAMTSPPTGQGAALHDTAAAERRYRDGLARNYFSLVYLAQAIAADAPALHIYCVSSQLQAVFPTDEVDPEKAVLLGPCKVIPREYPDVSCTSIDIDWPLIPSARSRLVDNLSREFRHRGVDGEIALRGGDRWIRRYDPVRPPAAMPQEWVRTGGTYVITGGLGGLALSIAEHLAKNGPVSLALIGRTSPPPEAPVDPGLARHGLANEREGMVAVQRLRALGADVLTIAADVGDREALRRALAEVHERFGAIHGLFHAAEVLQEQIIALRDDSPDTPVLDANFKTALVLAELFEEAPFSAEPPELFVLFSSVSAILGLPGQVEYTAASLALDRLAQARSRRAPGRTLSINWSAWRDVGVLADLVKAQRLVGHRPDVPWHGARTRHPATVLVANEDDRSRLFRASLSRSSPWVVEAPFLASGQAALGAAGLLEFVRAAFEHRPEPRAVEFRDVRFLAPIVVPSMGSRDLHIRIEHGPGHGFTCYGESEQELFAVGSVRYVDGPRPGQVDLEAIRTRCPRPASASEMAAALELAKAGPRWNNVLGVDLGAHEALVTLALPSVFAADLDTYHLHPALLEQATGAAQGMVPGFDARTAIHVPLSYGRVLVRGRLPGRLISHVRLCAEDRHSVALDATLYDDSGAEVAVIEQLVMRPLSRTVTGTELAAGPVGADARRHPEPPAEAALRLGITSAEGVEALDRILAAGLDPQIIASSVPLEPWLERLRADTTRSRERHDGAVAGRSGSIHAQLASPLLVPVDAIERDVAAMWRDVLELDEVETHEDFFDLGGHSLAAVRLFRRIRDTFAVDLPLGTLVEAPTIAELAVRLRDRIAGGRPPESPPRTDHDFGVAPAAGAAARSLVVVRHGADRTPLFVVHGAGGNVLNVRDLARAMEPTQTVFGLQASGIDGVSAPGATIEQMAQTYLDEIRVVQPHGPYLLAGYSGGGVIAFEMARRLDAAGEPIGVLAFIDTFHPQMALPQINVFTRLGRLRREGRSYLRDGFDRRRKSIRDDRDRQLIEKHLAAGEPIPLALRELYLIRSFERAATRYEPEPWPGKALLFRAEQVDYYNRAGGPAYGWDKTVLGGIEIVPVPGDHDSIMVGVNAARIAHRLGQAIDEVRSRLDQDRRG